MFVFARRYCLVSMLLERAKLTAVCIAVMPVLGCNRVLLVCMPKFFLRKIIADCLAD